VNGIKIPCSCPPDRSSFITVCLLSALQPER
jgi:hypothetical protein